MPNTLRRAGSKSGPGPDHLIGTSVSDTMHGLGGNDRIYARSGNDKVYGGDGDDIINGGDDRDLIDGGNGDDTIQGGPGSDTIYGGIGRDILIGGDMYDNARDTFVFRSTNDSRVDAYDVINWFESGVDRIDLSAIDADVSKAGNQAFQFRVDGQAFSGLAGEIIAVRAGSVTWVAGDVNGDQKADLLIKIFGTVTAKDFLL